MFCPGVLLTYAICVSERNSCTSQIWTERRRKTFLLFRLRPLEAIKDRFHSVASFPDVAQNQVLLTVNNQITQKLVIIHSLKRRVRNTWSVLIAALLPFAPDRLSGLSSGCSEGENFTGVQSVDFTAEGSSVLKCDEITAELLIIKHTGCFHISIKLLTEMPLVPVAACLC